MRREEQFQDMLARLFPEPIDENSVIGKSKRLARTVTFQITDACNLRCTYCYQINKSNHKMSFETAKKFIDQILSNQFEYINTENSPGLIIEFIGGEPLLEIDLMTQITDYFITTMIQMEHPWATKYMISICSNGLLYFNEKWQKYLDRYGKHISFSISVDGCKELHDACRILPDGSGSYDIAMAGVKDYQQNRKGRMGSKMTLAPANIQYTYKAYRNFIDNGYEIIHLNCVYEKGWEIEHAKILYDQLKLIADDILENDLENKIYLAMFEENFFQPKDEKDLDNWCWGAGTPILTSIGYKPIESIQIGDYVFTEDGTLHPVVDTKSHFADNVINIKTSGTFDLVCTDNHQVYAMPFHYRGNQGVKHFKPYGKYQIKDLQDSKDLIRLFEYPEGYISVPYELAYLTGRYIGDGWDAQVNGHYICCSFDETAQLKAHFDNSPYQYTINKNKTVDQFTIIQHDNNNELHNILKKCGHLATGKRIPLDCFNWDKNSLKALLTGYLDADGYSHSNGPIRCNTVSKELAEDLMLLLRTLGYTPTCNIIKRAGAGKIMDREVTLHDRYEISYYEDTSKTKYVKRQNGYLWTSHLTTSPADPQQVYNITVDTNHSYIAGGIVSSNCGGTGFMISCDWKGDIYPCIRYMESSLGTSVKPLIIGNVDVGIGVLPEHKEVIDLLSKVDRRTQSTDECFYCPIAEGCSWCSAYNYQETGTPNKRVTYICDMHKARALANVYFWNKKYIKHNEDKIFEMHCPKEWALQIISEEEYNMLLDLTQRKNGE